MTYFNHPDPDFITAVMQHPRVWRWVCCDGVNKSEMVYQEGEIYCSFPGFGFIMFRNILPGVFEIHIAMMKSPTDIVEQVHNSLREMRSRGAVKFIAPIGGWNLPALRLAEKCGFKKEGELSHVYCRGGHWHSLVMWGSL